MNKRVSIGVPGTNEVIENTNDGISREKVKPQSWHHWAGLVYPLFVIEAGTYFTEHIQSFLSTGRPTKTSLWYIKYPICFTIADSCLHSQKQRVVMMPFSHQQWFNSFSALCPPSQKTVTFLQTCASSPFQAFSRSNLLLFLPHVLSAGIAAPLSSAVVHHRAALWLESIERVDPVIPSLPHTPALGDWITQTS